MGLCRNAQSAKAIELWMQLMALVTFYFNAPTEEEKVEMGYTANDIFTWIRDEAHPQMEEIDMKFRREGPLAHRMWVRSM